MATTVWSPLSWKDFPAAQQPDWPDPEALGAVVAELSGQPPLVFAGEARNLLDRLGQVSRGEAFLLQAGDCAESFHDHTAPNLREKLKVILQMSAVLTYAASLPVVKVERGAGQFVKPRSSPVETIDGVELPIFRGRIVNSEEPTAEARVAD